jgi:UDP-GlcNAc:undecaprenyl-phosphate GlcNAc-1-phosphate transferase
LLDAGGFLAVFLLTAALTPLLMRHAARWRLVTLPDSRKLHSGAIPVIGGLAMGTAFLAGDFATRPIAGGVLGIPVAIAIAVTLLGGVLDDRHELSAAYKLAFQVTAAALLVLWGGAQLTHLGHLASPSLFTLGGWAIPLSLFAIVGMINVINMSDGLDGLAGSIALAACLCFGYAAATAGDATLFTAICLTAGAVAGFLLFNAPSPWRGPAAVYMGETGSSLLGLLLAWFAIRLAMSDHPALAPITAVWIVGLPMADTVTIIVRRVLRRKNPLRADREHLHHILLALGFSTGQTVLILFGATLLLGMIALAAEHAGVADHIMFYIAMAITLAIGIGAELLCRRLAIRQAEASEPAAAKT